MNVSFFLPKKYFPSDAWLQAWKEHSPLPLEESGKAATAHAWIYQTWALLAEMGVAMSLVTELPTSGIVFALSGTLNDSFRSDHHTTDFFLIDIVADGLPHPAAHVHLVQNETHAHHLPRSYFIPHWPQPALIPRQESRGKRFEKIAFFGNPNNLAPELLAPFWQERLKKDFSLELEIKRTDQWHNYADVDAVIAARDFSGTRQLHKPATKLYNAWLARIFHTDSSRGAAQHDADKADEDFGAELYWTYRSSLNRSLTQSASGSRKPQQNWDEISGLAGVPFIGSNDSAYQADGRAEIDYLVACSPEEFLKQLRRLKEDYNFRSRLIKNGNESGKKFNQSVTLERWKFFIQEVLPALALSWQKKPAYQHRCHFVTQRFFCWIDRKLR